MTDPQDRAPGEWRSGWPVVLASAMGMALSTIHVYSTGVFIAPLEHEFGWSRTAISAGLTFVSIISVISGPFVGLLIDRWGPRRLAVFGVISLCANMALLSLAGPSIWSWWALWLLMAIPTAGIKPTVWTSAVSSLFTQRRGLALSVMLCGTGLGSSLTPLIANALIERVGWREAYVGLAGFWAVLTIPPVVLLFTSAKDRRRTGPKEARATAAPSLSGLTAREGFASPRFYKLAIGAFLISLVAVSFVASLVPILSFTGLSRDRAAGLAGIVGIASIVGRLIAGWMLDRWNGNVIAGVSVALPVVAAGLLLAAPGNAAVSLLAVIVIGLCLGSELDAVAYLATRHLGMRSFGVLFGTIAGLLALSTGLGPLFVSNVYDRTQSYFPVLWAYMPLSLIASLMFLTLGRYPVHGEPEAEVELAA